MLTELLLLTACVLHVVDCTTQCYGILGCFTSHGDIPVPQSPNVVATNFILHTRGHTQGYTMRAIDYETKMNAFTSHFDSSKKTKVIIHGYLDSGEKPWISTLTSELLIKGDFNVFVIDWHGGSRQKYEQAAGNTYLVAAETAALLTHLHDHRHLRYADVHIIGHSLGAQTAGSVGHAIPSIGRITGLDPADPGFTGTTANRHLDASDAIFVDVIHTDASKFNLVSGYGTRDAVGDIDFYPNGGDHQPGCEESPLAGAIGSVSHGSIGGAKDSITCSHSRSRDLFIESINSKCKFYGHLCPSGDSFEAGSCLGCPASGCPMMGYDADMTKSQRGSFYLSTSGVSPYCGHEYFVDIKAADHISRTYGEFMVTLLGSKGNSEALKLESPTVTSLSTLSGILWMHGAVNMQQARWIFAVDYDDTLSHMHDFQSGDEEKHVIATHTDIGLVTGVRIQFLQGLTLLAADNIIVHSVRVRPAETNQVITFCAYEHTFNVGDTFTITSHSGC